MSLESAPEQLDDDTLTDDAAQTFLPILVDSVFRDVAIGGLRLSPSVQHSLRFIPTVESGSPHIVVRISWRFHCDEGVYGDGITTVLNGGRAQSFALVRHHSMVLAHQAIQTLVLLGAAKMGFEVTQK